MVLESDTEREGEVDGLSWLGCHTASTKNTGHPVKFEFQINNRISMNVSRVTIEIYFVLELAIK